MILFELCYLLRLVARSFDADLEYSSSGFLLRLSAVRSPCDCLRSDFGTVAIASPSAISSDLNALLDEPVSPTLYLSFSLGLPLFLAVRPSPPGRLLDGSPASSNSMLRTSRTGLRRPAHSPSKGMPPSIPCHDVLPSVLMHPTYP
ncbi:hypothetical protein BS47DRAFT_1396985 [Hydnum rufescens UP504]|uniref:Uncharacterized protein n=1 Tax=Hydnum rufescens UP504 TaxID=1448309 RepID=A0A9P6DPR8_9AGAM|nr:hypothetical protein BS47DRAFT_1396985 [Hydnum rufescens UP504]